MRPMICTVPYCTSLAFSHAVSAAMWSSSIFIDVFIIFPIARDEFVLQKLKKEPEEGAFIVRWSVLDYHRIILASLSQTKVIL